MQSAAEDRLQLIVPVKTRDGEVWVTQHAVDRFAEREDSIRKGAPRNQRQLVTTLRGRMKGGRIQLTRPAGAGGFDEDGYLVTGRYVWPLRKQGDAWLALTTLDR